MSDKVMEQQTGENLSSIVSREVEMLKASRGQLEYPSILRLEKLAKIYSILSANNRENIKVNAFSNMSSEDLEKLLNSDDSADDSSHDS